MALDSEPDDFKTTSAKQVVKNPLFFFLLDFPYSAALLVNRCNFFSISVFDQVSSDRVRSLEATCWIFTKSHALLLKMSVLYVVLDVLDLRPKSI